MALETFESAPKVDDFTPLSEHHAQTPGSFFGGKPVLHLRCPGATLKASESEIASQAFIAALKSQVSENEADTITGVDIWVTSSDLKLWSPATDVGVSIPYQAITVHAQDGNAVLLELNLSDANVNEDEDMEHMTLRIIPTVIEEQAKAVEEQADGQPNGHSSADPALLLYKAIGDCQELNPDLPSQDEDEDGFDETAPGATGWITSENMQDYLDEDGSLRMPEGATAIGGEEDLAQEGGLGEGAGRTRTAAEVDAEDGAEDEAKWQRTG